MAIGEAVMNEEFIRGFNLAIARAATRAEEQVHGHNCWLMTPHQLCMHIGRIIRELKIPEGEYGYEPQAEHSPDAPITR
jgi:hypothetical protein